MDLSSISAKVYLIPLADYTMYGIHLLNRSVVHLGSVSFVLSPDDFTSHLPFSIGSRSEQPYVLFTLFRSISPYQVVCGIDVPLFVPFFSMCRGGFLPVS